MENKYNNYINAFNELSLEDKRSYILENIDEIIKMFYKINIDYDKSSDILPSNDYDTEEEYLTEVFKKVVSLKGICASTTEIVLDNLYEGVNNE